MLFSLYSVTRQHSPQAREWLDIKRAQREKLLEGKKRQAYVPTDLDEAVKDDLEFEHTLADICYEEEMARALACVHRWEGWTADSDARVRATERIRPKFEARRRLLDERQRREEAHAAAVLARLSKRAERRARRVAAKEAAKAELLALHDDKRKRECDNMATAAAAAAEAAAVRKAEKAAAGIAALDDVDFLSQIMAVAEEEGLMRASASASATNSSSNERGNDLVQLDVKALTAAARAKVAAHDDMGVVSDAVTDVIAEDEEDAREKRLLATAFDDIDSEPSDGEAEPPVPDLVSDGESDEEEYVFGDVGMRREDFVASSADEASDSNDDDDDDDYVVGGFDGGGGGGGGGGGFGCNGYQRAALASSPTSRAFYHWRIKTKKNKKAAARRKRRNLRRLRDGGYEVERLEAYTAFVLHRAVHDAAIAEKVAHTRNEANAKSSETLQAEVSGHHFRFCFFLFFFRFLSHPLTFPLSPFHLLFASTNRWAELRWQRRHKPRAIARRRNTTLITTMKTPLLSETTVLSVATITATPMRPNPLPVAAWAVQRTLRRTRVSRWVQSRMSLLSMVQSRMSLLSMVQSRKSLLSMMQSRMSLLSMVQSRMSLLSMMQSRMSLLSMMQSRMSLLSMMQSRMSLLSMMQSRMSLMSMMQSRMSLLSMVQSRKSLLSMVQSCKSLLSMV
jgi:hypothetical protein